MLEIKNLTISLNINDKVIIDDFSFVLAVGDKAVIIGEEGNGKSSLLKLIYDAVAVAGYCDYSGSVLAKGRLGYLPQFFPVEDLGVSISDYFADANLGQHARIFEQLGLSMELLTQKRPISSLSGGEKIKLQLAKILMDEPDILLLDEPTNDIDMASLKWLEGFINTCRQPVMFISHDEVLIENTANVIIHIEQLMRKTKSRVTVARAGYADYAKTRGLAFDKQMMVAKKQRAEHKKQMDRWRQIHDKVEHRQAANSRQDPATGRLLKKKMKAVKSTGRRLEREAGDFLDIPQMEEAILAGFAPDVFIPAGKSVLNLELDGLFIGERRLTEALRLNVTGPQRVGIIGTNGVGKSTLLRHIWQSLHQRNDIIPAYMPQNYREVLDYDQPVLEFLASSGNKADITHARTYLGGMKFTKEEMTGKIGRLSGGQKAKLLFLDMVFKRANVLVLDEPTRNFSPLSAPEIRRSLNGFGGAIISVSHDRRYLAEVCTNIYELSNCGLVLAPLSR